MEIAFETDRGKVRHHNEDNGAIIYDKNEEVLFAIVADGMGGHKAGEVASKMAVDSLKESWENRGELSEEFYESWLIDNIKKANLEVLAYANQHPECSGMGTTLVTVICSPKNVVIGHVGDSRCYYGKQGELTQVTTDHTLVHELLRSGQITEEEAIKHPRKNVIMRAVGTEPNIEVDCIKMLWDPGDCLLLCSDGLTDKISNQEMKEIVYSEKSIDTKAKTMIDLANQAGGEDNITLAIIHFPKNEAGEVDVG